MQSILHLTFMKASGRKQTYRIPEALDNPDPVKVRALMEYILDKGIFYLKNDSLVSISEARLQNISSEDIEI